MLVTFPPGGATDLLARAVAQAMGTELGQPVTVVNRDGGAGSVGATAIAQARPDGYTIGFTTSTSIGLQPHLNPNLSYRLSSFTPVCQTFELIFALAVSPDAPYRTAADLAADARARPGALSFGVNGTGSAAHLAMAEFVRAAAVQMLHVPYRGDAPVVPALRSGDIVAGSLTASLADAQGLRLLGIFSNEPHPHLPQVPTLPAQGFAATQSVIGGVVAPAGLESHVRAALERACAAALRSEAYRTAADRLRERVAFRDGPSFGAAIEADVASKRALLDELGIRP
ncbi:tripartite tricarboxylate transporter substrate binding protein [Sabulicella rubraurantiaca]|uniref:tripartite tricarboxylate transporter substrate binding protein n=1 Tax=Sabulicella rubraurantiaca TaxID=2811429 RepID=UPI001A961A0C|nr:tripartite tricarboxylate transporter substrate binding protein [Sabulicella rubraurantiaca]